MKGGDMKNTHVPPRHFRGDMKNKSLKIAKF